MRLLSRSPARRDSSAYTPSLARLSLYRTQGRSERVSAAKCWVTAARPRSTLTSLRPRAYRLHLLSWRDEAHTDKHPSTAEVTLSARLHLPSQAVRTVKSASPSPSCGAAARGVVPVVNVMAGIIAVRSSLLPAGILFIRCTQIHGLVVLIASDLSVDMSLAQGYVRLGAGFVVGLAAGLAIAIVGDARVRWTSQQPRLSVRMASRPFSLHLPLRRAHRRSAGRQHDSHVTPPRLAESSIGSRTAPSALRGAIVRIGAQGRMFRVSRRRIGHGRAGYWRGQCGREAGQGGRAACELPVGQWREQEGARPRGQVQW
ncbi:hypothetical protein K438DRAFT_2135854 [Mycena galopus ATCC 62051]|nr:hypothetical protein K438DRAFT_2135854 [Mycena galopus ATCC 62051]